MRHDEEQTVVRGEKDEQQNNVLRARASGMHAIQYKDRQSCLKAIEALTN